mmetsp:Transcript_19994/g.28504  ORF Transcript_19994/g.28504 Transcript_19994/m.28504 type:complete len:94 (-) Transcript_19994:1442-1723(-)
MCLLKGTNPLALDARANTKNAVFIIACLLDLIVMVAILCPRLHCCVEVWSFSIGWLGCLLRFSFGVLDASIECKPEEQNQKAFIIYPSSISHN